MGLTALDYITINNVAIRKPEIFTPARQDVYAEEITTCTGKLIADRIGWKYADMTLHWDALPQTSVAALVSMSGVNTLEFDDPTSNTISEDVIRDSIVYMRHRFTQGGTTWWKDVEVDIRFITVHNS